MTGSHVELLRTLRDIQTDNMATDKLGVCQHGHVIQKHTYDEEHRLVYISVKYPSRKQGVNEPRQCCICYQSAPVQSRVLATSRSLAHGEVDMGL